jgi:hypothetical protein
LIEGQAKHAKCQLNMPGHRYPSASLVRLLASLSAFGAVIEILQAIPMLNPDSDPVDWLADTFAAALVIAGISWWRRKQELY